MKDLDRIYQLFVEANPAPVSTVSAIERPEVDTLLVDLRRQTVLTQEPKILEPRPVRSRTRRWRGPAAALTAFAAVAAVVGVTAWLGASGDGQSVATVTTLPPITTTVAPTETTLPPVTTTTPTTVPTVPVPAFVAVPDLEGLTVADARDLAEAIGFELVVVEGDVGSAIIVAQDPVPGVEVTEGAEVRVDAAVAPTCTPPAPPAAGVGEVTISVLFECGNDGTFPTAGVAVSRLVPEQDGEPIDRIEWTLRSLLAGPTDQERAAGFNSSLLSDATPSALNNVTLTDGRVVADFNDAIYVNNASTSTGGLFFNASLRANLFQHPEVDSVEFRVNGDCEAWSTFFQSDGCWIITRADWDQQLADWGALRSG